MATGTLMLRFSGGGLVREQAISRTGTASHVLMDGETVANGQTDLRIEGTVDVSAVKVFWIESDQNVTVETNSGSSPANTLSLIAGEPYIWFSTDLDTFKLTTDVTAFFVTNASGATATLYCGYISDATP